MNIDTLLTSQTGQDARGIDPEQVAESLPLMIANARKNNPHP